MTIIDYIIAKWGKLNCVNPPLTHRVKYKFEGARGAAKDFAYHHVLIENPLRWLQQNLDKHITLYDEPEALDLAAPQTEIIQTSLKPSDVNTLSAPNLPILKTQKPKTEKERGAEAQVYTIEDLALRFGVDDKRLNSLKEKYKKYDTEQEQKIAFHIIREAVRTCGTYTLKALPDEIYSALDANLVDAGKINNSAA